ncbi:MAG: carboxymuconolactone decarboxylase family protein [Bacteroidota bacterium]
MESIKVPSKEEVSENNQAIFDNLESNLGFVPNLYATYAYSDTALNDYLAFQNRKSSLKAKEREVINLVVSQVNECAYCLAAHTALGKMNGFTDDQILEIRAGEASFDDKIDALAKFVRDITINRSKPSEEALEGLFDAGYTKENLIDINIVIGDKMVSNFIHGSTQIPVDFPAAPELETALV